MSIAPTSADADAERVQLHYVDPVVFSNVDTSLACNGSPGEVAMVVAVEQLRIRFDAERRAMEEFFSAGGSTDLLPATIGFIDSGLATIGDDFFAEKFFSPNVDELNGIANQDDDGNALNDDIYGRNYFSQTEHGRVTPLPNAPRAAHGTKMGALALGGLKLAPTWTGTFDPPIVRLKVVAFYDGNPLNATGTASPALIPDAIAYLENAEAKVVNLSLATGARVAGLRSRIRESKNLLFVVAAGNAKAGSGKDLKGFELYPARLGGDRGERNVVTVAAHDLSGVRADFSHFSLKHVDLLAPGCAVETRNHEGDVVLDSGTSPATAIVSFTAGLIHALGLKKPSDIKIRLLAGTDFDPKLVDDAYSSGRLNIIKAISVFHDVVELKGSRPLLFGEVKNPTTIFDACETPQGTTTSRIHKVIPNVANLPDRTLEFWTEVDEELVRNSCMQSNEPIELILEIDGNERVVPITEIKEIILGKHISR